MPIFTNQASLSYGCTVTNSNVTEGELIRNIGLTKTATTESYGRGEAITYVVTLTSSGASYSGLTLTDDLGNISGVEGSAPLTYIDGSVQYFVNGIPTAPPEVSADQTLTLSGIDVPANGTVTVIYAARVNCCAPLEADSVIVNTVSAAGIGIAEVLTATDEVTIRNESQLTLSKAVCPDTFTTNDTVTYTLILQNTGNAPVVATDNLTVQDVFNPILRDVTVTLNGAPLAEGTGYTYNETTGEFTTAEGAITVPAATFAQNEEDCVVTTTPGVAVLTVTGAI